MDLLNRVFKNVDKKDIDKDFYLFIKNLKEEDLENFPDVFAATSSPLKRKREDDEQQQGKKVEKKEEKNKEAEENMEEDTQDEELGEFDLTASQGKLLREIFEAYGDKTPPSDLENDSTEVDGKATPSP